MFAMYFRLISYKSTWHRLWISKEGAGRGGGPEKWTSQILILWLTSKNKTMKQSRTLFWQVSKILNQGDGGGEGVWDVHNLTRESNIFPNPRNVKFGGGSITTWVQSINICLHSYSSILLEKRLGWGRVLSYFVCENTKSCM